MEVEKGKGFEEGQLIDAKSSPEERGYVYLESRSTQSSGNP